MTQPIPFVEIWRGPFLESVHRGHAVVCDAEGGIVHAWGDPDMAVLPRSSAKMIQALPLIESGAADARGLTTAQLALACASHSGMPLHVTIAQDWLKSLSLKDADLRCGSHYPSHRGSEMDLIARGITPCQVHNNCSGKHCGFLTLSQHLGGGPEYNDPDHPVQRAVLEAFERVTDSTALGYAIDGCSAPNFATTLQGMARAMAYFAASPQESAAARLHRAMRTHPEHVAGEGRACTTLMHAMDGKVAIKTGAEGFFSAILPDLKLGIALKISDGATRASECAMAAILVKLGVLEPDHPATRMFMNAPIHNHRDTQTGWIRPAPALL